MLILLDENTRISNIPNNIELQRKITVENKETGVKEEKWVWGGYYTSISGVLKGYLKVSVINSTAETLEELAAEIKTIKINIDRAIAAIENQSKR